MTRQGTDGRKRLRVRRASWILPCGGGPPARESEQFADLAVAVDREGPRPRNIRQPRKPSISVGSITGSGVISAISCRRTAVPSSMTGWPQILADPDAPNPSDGTQSRR